MTPPPKKMSPELRKRIERIIFIATGASAVMLIGLWLLDKKPNRDFVLPEGYEGWVTVRYSVPYALPLPLRDGSLQIIVNSEGYAETSTDLEVGWRRDRYFWQTDTGRVPIPASVEVDEEPHIYVHQHAYFTQSYEDLLTSLPVGADTTLPDGTHLERPTYSEVSYAKGKKTLEYFYLSKMPRSIFFNPPPNPDFDGLESTEDRAIPVQ
jgi:hypothetical protein